MMVLRRMPPNTQTQHLTITRINIERLILCVKTKAITRCRTMSRVSFERKLRESDQEENKEKLKYLCYGKY